MDTLVINPNISEDNRAFNFVVMTGTHVKYVLDPATRVAEKPKADYTAIGIQLTGRALLDTYARTFDQIFVAYNGPDEPPKFEPEDYPVQ